MPYHVEATILGCTSNVSVHTISRPKLTLCITDNLCSLDQAIWPLSPQERQAVLEHLQQSKFRGNASDELDASAIESVVESIITANSQNDDNVNLLVKIMKDSSPKDFLATK